MSNISKSKSAVIISNIVSIVQISTGVLFAFTFIGMIFTGSMPGIGNIIILLVLAGLSVWTAYLGFATRKLIKLFTEYATVLSVDPFHSIDNLSSKLGTSADTVKNNITKMIRKRFFVDAYVDNDSNCVVFANKANNDSMPLSNTADESEYTIVKCSGCGAQNKIKKNSISECDFCGSKISC